jgi:hypothetical protein
MSLHENSSSNSFNRLIGAPVTSIATPLRAIWRRHNPQSVNRPLQPFRSRKRSDLFFHSQSDRQQFSVAPGRAVKLQSDR